MQIRVKVNAGAQGDSVRRLAEVYYQVRTSTPAVDGKANRRVIQPLGEKLRLPTDCLRIVAGQTSALKWVELVTPGDR